MGCTVKDLPPTGTVGGTGTDNRIARWDGADDIQSSGVTLDDTANMSGTANFSQTGQAYRASLTTNTPTGTTQTIDFNNGTIQTLNLGSASGNVTVSFSNPQITNYILIVTQGSTPRTVTWPTTKWVGGTAPTLAGASGTDLISLTYDGTSYWGSYSLNHS